jgi:hypothetical protein
MYNVSAMDNKPRINNNNKVPSFVTNPSPMIGRTNDPFAKKNVYDTGKVDVQIPEMMAFQQNQNINMEQEMDINESVSSDEFSKNFKSLPLIEKTETMKIYYNIVFCNLLASVLIVKYEEMCRHQKQEPSSDKFHLFINQHLLQDPSTFRFI